MRIPALALAERALVLDARGHAASQLRGLLVVLAMVALVMAVASSSWFGAPGLNFYRLLGDANFWFIAAFGISAFTTVVTEEKENHTLGLLKLAGFGSLSILVGKSIGQLLNMLLLLLVQVPFALLAFTLGGVSRHQILAGWLLLLAHLLLVYALGRWLRCWHQGPARPHGSPASRCSATSRCPGSPSGPKDRPAAACSDGCSRRRLCMAST